jgi:hypothetical protein
LATLKENKMAGRIEMVKSPKLEVVTNGFIVSYDAYYREAGSTYDSYDKCEKEVFALSDKVKALDRLIELSKEAGLIETSEEKE